ncbi:uncharacterized protein PITG_10613 [Phytophthora infestans T30-4]|uniref:ATP-dependent DNA helicase n=1 Tax=Phytophthora infestans (strain T30-4) TaxID=403677 RepID=D0NFQ1_PHYIT|nr:uncharacterized protein PITG_10613 [Phytophthora infestans T30-4]EEY57040.1 hypothetical protein PITG_10613 [Phytophthora infestans T30-4]|eukprot:XP_002902368.1 hypothetical protein PITG_10613 [Phytophthora infestans T30-4]
MLPKTPPGGTGKTRIIDALRCLACRWGRPKCVMATSSSGIAAANLKVQTMHSSVHLGINQMCLPRHIMKPDDKLRDKWDPVLSLQKVKDCLQPFGGLIAVFMFDFFQLLTVRGIPVFKVADPETPYSEMQARGSLRYRSINKVVYLTQNMRFLIQIISTDNAYHKRINDAAIRTASRTFPPERKVYAVPAQLPATLTPAKIAKITDLPDNQTGNIPACRCA